VDDTDELAGITQKCFFVCPTEADLVANQDKEPTGKELLQLNMLESRMATSFMTKIPNLDGFGEGPAAYICAKLWESSDLSTFWNIQEFQASLPSKEAVIEADRLYHRLCHLDSPWFESRALPTDSLWSQKVFEAMKFKTLGRMLFPVILEHIRMQFHINPGSAADKLAPFSSLLEAWTTEDAWEQVEKQLLLKELRIGRRAKELPMWMGDIATRDTGHQRDVFLLRVRLRVPRLKRETERGNERAAYVRGTHVDLSEHKDLLTVPEDVRHLKEQVLVIKLSSSLLKTLPEWLGDLTGLEQLNLEECYWLKVLPERLGDLTGLQTLDLHLCTRLTFLPERLGDLAVLKKLNLNGCEGLQILPERLGFLTGLKKLDLTRCIGLVGLPERLGDLTGLQTLNLEMCGGLTGLPERMGDMVGLHTLNLQGCNGLTGLPDRMGYMTGLKELFLGWCGGLQGLPERLGDLTGLKMLDLRGCKGIIVLPHVMGSLTRLKNIKLI